MNKSELVSALASSTSLTQKDVAKVLDAFVSTVGTTLKKGEDITLVGFGAFKVSQRQARTGRNPKTGAPLKIAASKVPQFKAGKALKEAIA
jgi:DNA-binding protein HU-beta